MKLFAWSIKNITVDFLYQNVRFKRLFIVLTSSSLSKVYLVHNTMFAAHSTLYITLDGGTTFKQVQLPFHLMSSIAFHQTNPKLLLALDDNNHVRDNWILVFFWDCRSCSQRPFKLMQRRWALGIVEYRRCDGVYVLFSHSLFVPLLVESKSVQV